MMGGGWFSTPGLRLCPVRAGLVFSSQTQLDSTQDSGNVFATAVFERVCTTEHTEPVLADC